MRKPSMWSDGGAMGLTPPALIGILLFPSNVNGHGYMKSPRTRNWYAHEEGVDSDPGQDGVPRREYCFHCLNMKQAYEICGVGGTQSYDEWKDFRGNPMPWESQETFVEGQEFVVTSILTTNHAGHMELRLCADGPDSTEECFVNTDKAMFVEDLYFNGPRDANYPTRGYYAAGQDEFKFKYRLPMGVVGERVMMQWRYVTANNCNPPGYLDPALDLEGRGWLRTTTFETCKYPLDPTGARSTDKPEQFWNCAEITILPANGTVLTPHPATPVVPTPIPPVSPSTPTNNTPTASSGPGYCNWGSDGTSISSICDGDAQGGPDCNAGEYACRDMCGGNWCWGEPSNGPTAPAPTPASPTNSNPPPGYCNFAPLYGNPCDGKVQGGIQCQVDQVECEDSCGGSWCLNPLNPTPPSPTHQTSPTIPPPTQSNPMPPAPTSPTAPSGTTGIATTTRYWDCSGGACGCAYLPFGPGTDSEPAYCHSNAMFAAPAGNPYGAKFYGTAAISDGLGGGSWLAPACNKCWKVTGTSNAPGYSGVETTLVLKGANRCPPWATHCHEGAKHFDISAPGFDVLAFSDANTCLEREAGELAGFQGCSKWMIDSQDPDVGCDCSTFNDPVLKAGCENFLSLKWDNPVVFYEEVECPQEMVTPCWEGDGNVEGYPQSGIPETCASPTGDPNAILPFPEATPTTTAPPSPMPPTPAGPFPNALSPTPSPYTAEPIACPAGWHSASWTWYISYPLCCPDQPHYDPNADTSECELYNGCSWDGDFAHLGHRPLSYVQEYDLVAFFSANSNSASYAKKFIRMQAYNKTVEVMVADTCGDTDCNGCCTQNAAPSGNLLDMEYYTVMRHFGQLENARGQICWQLVPDEEVDTGGYCNWSGCDGVPGAYDCNVNQFECENNCGGTWCTGGPSPITTPTPPAPTPPAPTAPAPTNPLPTNPTSTNPAPTAPAPTNPLPTNPAPTNLAPAAPTDDSGGGECCSDDWKTCKDEPWCSESSTNCDGCGEAVWMNPDNNDPNCLPRYTECTNTPDSCCNGMACTGSQWWKTCTIGA